MVQARWGHMNREHSLLTRTQALMLDGHHLVENRARAAAGWLFNFSGTGGMWRKEAIASAGGWQHDTLTEDLDLSYRAQLAGWRFVYRENVVTPAELPEDISAFRAQQFRWAKGTVQTARKLLGRILRVASSSLMQRIEAFFHMTPHFAYPLMVLLSVLLLPALVLMPATDRRRCSSSTFRSCIGTTGSLAAFYAMAEVAQGRRRSTRLKQLPALLALGAGLAPHLTKAVWEGLHSMAGEFVRTPKKGTTQGRYRAAADLPMIEIALCARLGWRAPSPRSRRVTGSRPLSPCSSRSATATSRSSWLRSSSTRSQEARRADRAPRDGLAAASRHGGHGGRRLHGGRRAGCVSW